jgi:hypothetical protein
MKGVETNSSQEMEINLDKRFMRNHYELLLLTQEGKKFAQKLCAFIIALAIVRQTEEKINSGIIHMCVLL